MADKISRKSSIRTRNGSKDSSFIEQTAPATSSAQEVDNTATLSTDKKRPKKRKSSTSVYKIETNTSDLVKKSIANSKQTATNSPVSSTSSAESNKVKKKKKQKLSSPDSSETPRTSVKSKSVVKLPKTGLIGDSDEDTVTNKSSRRRSNDSSQSSRLLRGHRNDSSISESYSIPEDKNDSEAVEINTDTGEEYSYHNRLRKPSSSSSKSTSKLNEKDSFEAPSKRQKLTNFPTTSKHNSVADKKLKRSSCSKFKDKSNGDKVESDQISNKNQSNKKETGACISNSRESSHPTSNSRNLPQPPQAETTESSQALTSQEAASYDKLNVKSTMSGRDQHSKSTKNISSSTSKTPAAGEKSASSGVGGLIESAESSDNDTSAEFNRLSDILQSRGLPSHIVNAFGSKVQQFLHRTMSSGISGRSQNLINSLQQPDDSLKLTALAEICQLLVMGNEDTLVGFPIKQAVPLLLQCMNSESENFDLMNHACRALTYMMESLPRSSSIIAEGIGIFLEKLQVIQCMDVAEQSLTALEILSRRHSKQILSATQSGSISACLTYIDFFSITAQRNALQITASCCQNMIKDEFVNIQSSLSILSQRLTHSDKKSVESVCTIFARLVENFQKDSIILKEIASHNVLLNLQQLLVVQPSVVSSSMLVTILHTIYLMCANCTELATELLENNISNTFITLLIGNTNLMDNKKASMTELVTKSEIEILSTRSTQELYEIVAIIGEIMPSLPKTGIFSIDETLHMTSAANFNKDILWQWKDEREVWRPYTPADSRIIESAYNHEENECILNTSARSYLLDFTSMMQINEETGTARPIARKLANSQNQTNNDKSGPQTSLAPVNNTNNEKTNPIAKQEPDENEDSRLTYLKKNQKLYAEFVSSLLAIVYAVYSSSAGPAIKHRCLRSLLRMIYYSSYDSKTRNDQNNKSCDKKPKETHILYNLLKNLPISSQIASMLASSDTKILVSGLQMCEILMQKIPSIFSIYFHREGVIHQIERIIESSAISTATEANASMIMDSKTPATSAKTDTKKSVSDKPQRKTRSATAAEITAGNELTVDPEDTRTLIAENQSKRKMRPSGSSKHASFQSFSSPSKTSIQKTLSKPTEEKTVPQEPQPDASGSLTSNTAKYFRNMITKMHSAPSTSTSSNSKCVSYQIFTPSATASNQAFDKSSKASNVFSNQANDTSAGHQETASKSGNEFFFNNEPLWRQLKKSSDIDNQDQLASFAPNCSKSNAKDSKLFDKLTPNQFLAQQLTKNSSVNLNKNKSDKTIEKMQTAQRKNSIDYNTINVNKERVRQWIFEQAKKFLGVYFQSISSSQLTENKPNAALSENDSEKTGLNVLNHLIKVADKLELGELVKLDESVNETSTSSNIDKSQLFAELNKINKSYLESLAEISNILNETDISSFEMIHSGLINRLVGFLSIRDLNLSNLEKKLNQNSINYSSFSSIEHCSPAYIVDLNEAIKNEFKSLRCKQFLTIFSNLPSSYYCSDIKIKNQAKKNMNFFSSLLGKLHNCVNQQEQFAVKVSDVSSSAGGSGESKNAIKFFNTHQLKCLLRRHPSCSTSSTGKGLSQWKGGPVKVDPLAAISTIEKYLMCRGIHVIPSSSSQNTGSGSSNFLSSSFPSSTSNQKSLGGRFSKSASKSKTQSAIKNKSNHKSPSSRLFILKAAAEIAADRFKFKKARQNTRTKSIDLTSGTTQTKVSNIDVVSPKNEIKKPNKSNKKFKKNEKASKDKEAAKTPTSLSKKSPSSRKKTSKSKKVANNLNKPMDLFVKSNESANYLVDNDDGDLQDFEGEESIDNDEYELTELHDRIDEDLNENDDENDIDYDDDLIDEDDIDEDDLDENDIDEDDEIDEDDSFDHEEIEDEINESDDDDDDDDEDFNEDDHDNDDDDDDDPDIEGAMNAILGTIRGGANSKILPKIELLINDHVLPSNMSVYQAIKMYSNELNEKEQDNELENSFMNNKIWSKMHLIYYRLAESSNNSKDTKNNADSNQKRITRQSLNVSTSTPSTSKSKSSKNKSSKTDLLDITGDETSAMNLSNISMNIVSTMFYSNFTNQWPAEYNLSIHDQSIGSISLLRLLNTLNRNWYLMYADLYGQNYFNTLKMETHLQEPTFLVNSEQFINTKLAAKANRQLQDPLVIMTGHLPKWLPELMQTCPFLFPFKTRLMYFYVSTLDRDRAIQKLIELNANIVTQSESDRSNDRFVPKLEKKKRTIARYNDLIKQTDSIMNEFCVNSGSNPTSSGSMSTQQKAPLLEIQYEGEVGTGLGPTLEFYALVSQEIQKCEYEMWRGDRIKLESVTGQNKDQFFFFSSTGLFPAPFFTGGKMSSKQQTNLTKIKSKFKFLGKFVAKAVMDFRVLDIQFSYTFYKWLISPNSLCEDDIKYVDAGLFNSIESLRNYLRKRRQLLIKNYEIIETGKGKQSDLKKDSIGGLKTIEKELKELENTVEAIDLDFTMPGYGFELKKGGKDEIVKLENLEEYLKLIVEWTLVSGVQQQLDSFKEGFDSILPISCLKQFYPEELERLFCGSGFHKWNLKILNECTRCDHGYTHDSKAVKNLFEVMCSFNETEQRQFLQFITGSPRLPVGGLQSLVPLLTIVRKTTDSSENTASNVDSYLPSVMTCVNYLKLPDYSSVEIMKEKLLKAMQDGQLSFHLS